MIDQNSIKITKLFPTPLSSILLPESDALNRELKIAILAREAETMGVDHSNDGGWQSADDFSDWTGSSGAQLIDLTKKFANCLSAIAHPEFGLIESELSWTFNAWANVNRSGHANVNHVHPGSYWSGVYWVDDGSDDASQDLGGLLEFVDPRGAVPTMLSPHLRMKIDGCLSAGLTQSIKPFSGMLVIFPSWLMHSVTTYRGTRPRISVAINLAP